MTSAGIGQSTTANGTLLAFGGFALELKKEINSQLLEGEIGCELKDIFYKALDSVINARNRKNEHILYVDIAKASKENANDHRFRVGNKDVDARVIKDVIDIVVKANSVHIPRTVEVTWNGDGSTYDPVVIEGIHGKAVIMPLRNLK
jgi:hypothetical protein